MRGAANARAAFPLAAIADRFASSHGSPVQFGVGAHETMKQVLSRKRAPLLEQTMVARLSW